MITSHKNPVLTDYRTAREEGYVHTPLDWYEIASSDMSSGANPGWHPTYTTKAKTIITRIQNARNLHLLELATQAIESNANATYIFQPGQPGKLLVAKIASLENTAADVWCLLVRPGCADFPVRFEDLFIHPMQP